MRCKRRVSTTIADKYPTGRCAHNPNLACWDLARRSSFCIIPAWTRCTPPSRSCRRGLYPRRVLLPALSSHKTKANELASESLDGAHARCACSTAQVRRVRRSTSIGEAVAMKGRAWQAGGTQGLAPIAQCQRHIPPHDDHLILTKDEDCDPFSRRGHGGECRMPEESRDVWSAKRCLKLAAEAPSLLAKAKFENLARTWMRLATDLDHVQGLLQHGSELKQPKTGYRALWSNRTKQGDLEP